MALCSWSPWRGRAKTASPVRKTGFSVCFEKKKAVLKHLTVERHSDNHAWWLGVDRLHHDHRRPQLKSCVRLLVGGRFAPVLVPERPFVKQSLRPRRLPPPFPPPPHSLINGDIHPTNRRCLQHDGLLNPLISSPLRSPFRYSSVVEAGFQVRVDSSILLSIPPLPRWGIPADLRCLQYDGLNNLSYSPFRFAGTSEAGFVSPVRSRCLHHQPHSSTPTPFPYLFHCTAHPAELRYLQHGGSPNPRSPSSPSYSVCRITGSLDGASLPPSFRNLAFHPVRVVSAFIDIDLHLSSFLLLVTFILARVGRSLLISRSLSGHPACTPGRRCSALARL